jgi:hypothetical protein
MSQYPYPEQTKMRLKLEQIEKNLYAQLGRSKLARTGAINGYLLAQDIKKQITHTLRRAEYR